MKQEPNYWKLIEEIGWGKKTTDYTEVAREWYAQLGKEGMEKLRAFVSTRVADLQTAVKKYEDEHKQLECGSDDGFSDVTHHIVGMGWLEWSNAMKNPKLVETRYNAKYGTFEAYTESFAYCFQEPPPVRTEKDKRESIVELVERAEEIQKTIRALQKDLYAIQQEADTLWSVAALVKKDAGL
jgi:hypothetical protein